MYIHIYIVMLLSRYFKRLNMKHLNIKEKKRTKIVEVSSLITVRVHLARVHFIAGRNLQPGVKQNKTRIKPPYYHTNY